MKYMGLNEIREAYLSFFESKGHLRMPSFSLVPNNDPSILLINAGMTPLKPYFTGAEVPPSLRVTTCQKCIRTPDIEQVGFTARHGTYFEMLGNFSFGDYFKHDAITWAWEFVTEHLEMEPELVHVTVFREDDEAYDIWHDVVGLPEERITRLGKEDNFWEHGSGPSGPCSELFYDRGVEKGCGKETCGVDCDCDRFIEFWNLVFTQFDRQADGSYLPLAKKNIDTGAGLERIAAVMQGVNNLFEVDTVRSVLDKVCEIAGVRYGDDPKTDVAIRVVTDHIRSTTMMVSDGILPSNEGRGYVLRRLLRRASRYGRLLGIDRLFLNDLTPLVIENSKIAYPELEERRDYILNIILREEARFEKTIRQGSGLLDDAILAAKAAGSDMLSGDEVFRLHDTYGFPLDLTREIAAEAGLGIDQAGFQANMDRQKEQARAAITAKGGTAWGGSALPEEIHRLPATDFSGYDRMTDEARVLFLATYDEESGDLVSGPLATSGSEALIVVDRSPFYAESGGQVGDIGLITTTGDLEIEITDTTKSAEGVYIHHGRVLDGTVNVGDTVQLQVDRETRLSTMRNHSTTHLLHKALRTVLGDHVTQAGSLVTPSRLRFDFAHYQAVTKEEIREIERLVNEAILADYPITATSMSMAEAKESGAMALFDEKYGDTVRVISMGDYSCELCGGTHLDHTSQAGLFKIVGEQSIASGVRRVEAMTGRSAFMDYLHLDDELKQAADRLKTTVGELQPRIEHNLAELKAAGRKITELEGQLASASSGDLLAEARDYDGIKVLVTGASASSVDILKDLANGARDSLQPAVVLMGARMDDKLNFVAMASPEAVKRGIHCGQLVKAVATVAGGGGGGRPDTAMAGAKDLAKLDDALELARQTIAEKLG